MKARSTTLEGGAPPASGPHTDATRDEILRADELVDSHRGLPLEASEFRCLSPALALRLARHDAELSLVVHDKLHAPAARELCRHRLLRLDFRRVPLDDDLAKVLAGHQGILWIDGLKTLPSAKSDVLTRHNGPVFVADETTMDPAADERLQERAFQSPILLETLDLAGTGLRVRRMTMALAEALVFFRHGWMVLDALEDLSVDQARLLGARHGRLSLNGLKEISPQVAAKLVAHSIAVPGTYISSIIDNSSPWWPWTRHLCLNGLTHLRAVVARKLVHYRGILELNGLRTLEIEAAESLVKVDGEVHLKGLEHLEEKVACVLGPRRHILRLSPQLEKMLEKQGPVSRGR